MEKCSFLSTYEQEVICFEECPFYCNEESDSICPFKSVTGKSGHNIKRLYKYYFPEELIPNFIDETEEVGMVTEEQIKQ